MCTSTHDGATSTRTAGFADRPRAATAAASWTGRSSPSTTVAGTVIAASSSSVKALIVNPLGRKGSCARTSLRTVSLTYAPYRGLAVKRARIAAGATVSSSPAAIPRYTRQPPAVKPPGSNAVTAATRAGRCTAWLSASQPPRESPRRCAVSRSSPASTVSSHSACDRASDMGAVCTLRPASPSVSTAKTVCRAASSATHDCHMIEVAAMPCSRTSGGPSPQRRTLVVPYGVTTLSSVAGTGQSSTASYTAR